MSVHDIVETIVSFVRDNQAWAAPMAFVTAFLESFCFLSILWPGTAILVGISALLAAGGMKFEALWPAIVAAGFGGSLGYAISYWLGLYFKDRLVNSWPFNKNPDTITQGKAFFDKYGTASVFLGHFFGPVRAVIPVVAGMYAMKQLPFQIANIASAFIWAAGVIAPGFFLVTFKTEIFDFITAHQYIATFGMFALAFIHALPVPLIFWPTLALLFGGSLLFIYAGGSASLLFLAGVAGTFLGDLVAYSAGESQKGNPKAVWPLNWYPEGIPAARAFIERWGAAGIVFSKFMGLKRAYVPVVAGTTALPRVHFLPASLLSALLLTAVLLAPRYVLTLLGW